MLGDTVTLGPYRAGAASVLVTTDDRRLADDLAAMLVDLLVAREKNGFMHRGEVEDNDRPTVPNELIVTTRGPTWLTHRWGVWRDGEPCETTVDEGYIHAYVIWEITRLALETASMLQPVHAAAVSFDDRGIVLAGSSGAGKSTTAGWLTHRGWGFLTDEVSLLDRRADDSWWVEPFPRPIGIRRPSPLEKLLDHELDEADIPVAASRFGRIGGAVPLVGIVLIDRVHVIDQAEPIAPATSVRLLAEELPGLRDGGRPIFRGIVELVQTIPVWRVGTADLERAEHQLRDLIETVAS